MSKKKPPKKKPGKKKTGQGRSNSAPAEPLLSLQSIEGLLADISGAGRGRRSAVDEAQEIMYDAWEAPNRRRAVALANKALEVSADCADAYNLLAEETAESPEEAVELYRKGVEAGERALGKKVFFCVSGTMIPETVNRQLRMVGVSPGAPTLCWQTRTSANHVKFFLTLRWIARVLGSLLALFFLLMGLGYAIGGDAQATQEENFLTMLGVVTIFTVWIIGIILAWKWEGIGGGIILLSTIIFFIVVPDALSPFNPLHLLPVIGILFLICWWRARVTG